MVRQFAAHNVQMYTNKLVVYAKFLEAVQSHVCKYNIHLLSSLYFDPDFFIGWKLFCIFFISSFWSECLDSV